MDVLNQKQWLEKYKLCSIIFFNFAIFWKIEKLFFEKWTTSTLYSEVNGHKLDEDSLKGLTSGLDDPEQVPSYVQQLKALFSNACMRKRLLIMFVQWITVVLSYQGLTLNNVNLVRTKQVCSLKMPAAAIIFLFSLFCFLYSAFFIVLLIVF
jgi:hypothetical protein